MKKTFYINENRLYAPLNLSELFSEKKLAGYSLTYKEFDEIEIVSGAVCAFDAYKHSGVKPFLNKLPLGACRPFCFTVPTSIGSRVAFAGLKFSDMPAEKWKLALFEEKDVLKLTQDDESVVSVIESGIIAFSDYITMRDYDSVIKENEDNHPLDRFIRFDGSTAFTYTIDSKPALAVFSSGWGDGNYSCYIGLDGGRRPAALICDFGMIQEPKKQGSGKTVPFVFDIEYEQLYQNDPRLSLEENNAAKWTMVIENTDESDISTLYKAYSRRGYAYHNLGRLEAALSDYYKALEILESTEKVSIRAHEWTIYDNAGTINKTLGNNAEAIRLFEKARKSGDSFYSGAYLNLIDIYSSEKDYEKAILLADEMIRDRPYDPVAYMKSAELHVTVEDYSRAIADYNILIEKFQWDEAILEKTSCLSVMSRYTEALECLETYIVENKPNEFYYYNKGFLEYKLGNYAFAYDCLVKALEYNAEFTPTLNLLIEIDDFFINWRKLVSWSDKYVAIRPTSEYGYIVRGDANLKLKNYSEAQKDYLHVISHISSDVKYFHDYILAAAHSGNFSKCKKAAAKLKKTSPAAHSNALGIIAFAKKRYIKSEKYLLAAFDDGFNDKYAADLINFYIHTSKFNQAEAEIKRYEQNSPESTEPFLLRFALITKKGGDFDGLFNGYVKKFFPNLSDENLLSELKNRLSGIKR